MPGHVLRRNTSSISRRCTSEALLVEIGPVSARRELMYRQSPHHAGGSSQREILQKTVVFDADDESRLIEIAPLPGGPPAVQVVGVLRRLRFVAQCGELAFGRLRGQHRRHRGTVYRQPWVAASTAGPW